jgi:cardiolipin synthase
VLPRRTALAFALVVLFVCSAAAGSSAAAATAQPTPADNATLVEAYPNPVERGDTGEFVATEFATPTNTTGWVLTDGRTAVPLPNRTFDGTVAFAKTPETAQKHTDHPVIEIEGGLRLANDGERLELRNGSRTVDIARYRTAPESRIRNLTAEAWRPVGATNLRPANTSGGNATVFVLPDADDKTTETLREADDRLFLAGYTLTSERVTDALVEAHENGADVRVLLDGNPVGGVTKRQARQLDRLIAAGIAVRLLDGPHTRYRYHHPKYAVVDGKALVLTENFKPAGTGGMSSRGWGVVLEDVGAADALAKLHTDDWEWRAATPWEQYRAGRTFSTDDPALGSFETRHQPKRVAVDSATVLVSPDNAGDALVSRLDGAERRVLVQQVEISSRDSRLLRAVLRAADRGVEVKIHLSDAWYVAEDNAALVAWLNQRAESEGWNLEARVDTADGYEKIHTKGVVIDETAIVGSLNWANAATEHNREVLIALESDAAADYYAGVFTADWSDGGQRPIPAGVLGAVAVAGAGALLAAKRVEFVGRDGVVTDWQW